MKFLVTTSKSLLLINYYSNTVTIDVLHQGYGLYYGITYSEDYIYVAARKRMLTSSEKVESENGVILVFDKQLRLQEEIICNKFPLRDIHQIQYFSDKLFVTCSFDNMIGIYDFKKRSWEQWFPNQNIKNSDINHFNSFFINNNNLYLLAHNFGESTIYTFNINNLFSIKEKINIGKHAHNIWVENNELYVCSSSEEIIKSTGYFEKKLYGFLRGVAISDNFYFIGSSEMTERKNRDFTDGKLFVLNKQWELIDEISIKKEGMILDIKLINSFDYSINKIFITES